MPLPTKTVDRGYNDIESIESNIDTLYNRFILPIEKIRSYGSIPYQTLSSSQISTLKSQLKTDIVPVESLCHAFYRYLGLPTVAKSGSALSPGFNPNIDNSKRDALTTNLDSTTTQMTQDRENHVLTMKGIIDKQDIAASVFELVMAVQPRLFNAFDQEDQSFKVSERDLEVDLVKRDHINLQTDIDEARTQLASTPITSTFDGGKHILKPFQVDPLLDFATVPLNNLMAAPFLADSNAAKSSAEPEIIHVRPVLESILRARLTDNVPDASFMTNLQNILTQIKSPSPDFTDDINTDALRSTLFALAEDNKVDNLDIDEIFNGFSSTQAIMVKNLIKMIKAVVKQLHFAVSELEKIRQKIGFLPILKLNNKSGVIGTVREGSGTLPIDNQILQLTIKKLNAERRLNDSKNLGPIANPFLSLEKTDTYAQQLQVKTQLRKNLGDLGLKYVRQVEIITGEISGLGLIDVLAIYTALFSMSLEDVLGLLDSDAFNRLYDLNPELRTGPLASKSPSSPLTSLSSLETKVSSILSFADKLYADSLGTNPENFGDLS